MLRTPLLPGQAQTPHQSLLCAPENQGQKERDRAAQDRGAQPMSHLELSVHNSHLRLITLLFAGQKFFLPAQQEAQHWLLPFFSYRELLKLPLCQESRAGFTGCKIPAPHRTQLLSREADSQNKDSELDVHQCFHKISILNQPLHFGHPLRVSGFPLKLQHQNKEQLVTIWPATASLSAKQ